MNRVRSTLLVTAALLAGCGSSGNGSMTVMLKDAPANLKAAVVTITEIDLVGADGVVVLSNTKTTTNLLTLANSAATLVQDAVVKPGTYTELRFVISGGYVEVPDAVGTGSTIYASSPSYEGLPDGAKVSGTLRMPSFAQSGLKVTMLDDSLTIAAESKVILVDFDVEQSFGIEAGNSGAWVMHPVITGAAITMSGNVNVTTRLGTGVTLPILNGTTQVTLGNFNAVLTNSDGSKTVQLAPISLGLTTYGSTFKYLWPGVYTLTLAAPAGMSFTASPVVPDTVTVVSGADTNVDFTITAASAP